MLTEREAEKKNVSLSRERDVQSSTEFVIRRLVRHIKALKGV